MRLNEEQLSVIRKVRALMSGDDQLVPRYICPAIGIVISALEERGEISEKDGVTLKHNVCSGILGGIDHHVTFGAFITKVCPPLRELLIQDDWTYYEALHMARLAWLDWIIYTGEIKAEKLLGED